MKAIKSYFHLHFFCFTKIAKIGIICNTMSQIELKNVSYAYSIGNGRSLMALKNLSLEIEEGEFVALAGMNGSGKSTLAKLLNGLFIPQSGTIKIDGLLTSDPENTFEIRKRVGMVFQNPDNQMVATIIEDDIAFGPENLGVPRDEIIKNVEWALDVVGMSNYRKGTASKLSGGQKQRVAIAGVLAMQPKVLVLDESTSMLDPLGRHDIMDIATKLNKQGITVINITHNMEEAAIADRVIVMKKGRLAIDGTPKQVFSSGLVEDCGLRLPPVTKLYNELKDNGFNFDSAVISDEALVEGICKQLK